MTESAAETAPGTIRRVLLVAAHPDDETLTAGGLVAELARRVPLTVVTCTRGERGELIGSDLQHLVQDADALAGYRVQELRGALLALGVAEHVFLDQVDGGARLVDSGMSWDEAAPHVRAVPAADAGPDAFSVAPLERSVANLVAVIDRVQPDLVLVDEPDGGYGHPDHRRAHEVTMLAVERAAQRPAHVAWPVRPRTAVTEAHAWLRARPDVPTSGVEGMALTLAAPDDPLPSIVVADEAIDVAVDVTDTLPAVTAAMAAHRSQVQAIGLADPPPEAGDAVGWYALSNGLLQPILRRAWLRTAQGWDGARLRSAVERLTQPAPAPTIEEETGRWFRPVMVAFALVLGIVLAAVGTAFHRSSPPFGLIGALVALVAGGVLTRSFLDRLGHVVFGVAAVAMVFVMTYVRPGGDILVTNEPIGLVWLVGSIPAALLLPALAPRSWFHDR